jgi:hypothetical protein
VIFFLFSRERADGRGGVTSGFAGCDNEIRVFARARARGSAMTVSSRPREWKPPE